MSVEQVRINLAGDSPGRQTELNYYRIGPEDAEKKVYLQFESNLPHNSPWRD